MKLLNTTFEDSVKRVGVDIRSQMDGQAGSFTVFNTSPTTDSASSGRR